MAKAKKKKPSVINWGFIEPIFRMGIVSNCQITRDYAEYHRNSKEWKPTISEASIRKQANRKGWKKKLAAQVPEKIREKLVRSSSEDESLTDDELLEIASDKGLYVVLRHRKEIASLAVVEAELLSELGMLGALIKKDIKKEDKVSLKDKSIILKNISHVRAQRIALEREAYNLDNQPEESGDNEILVTVENYGD